MDMTPESKPQSRRVFPVFALLAVVFIVSASARYVMQRAVQRAEKDIADEQAIIRDLQQCLSTIKDAETGQRGYLLTGDESYLTPNIDAQNHIQHDLADLDGWTRAGILDVDAVKRYRALTDAKLREMNETIVARRTLGFPAALAIVLQNRGKGIMDQLRQLTDDLVRQRYDRLDDDSRAEKHLASENVALFWIVISMNLGFIAWAYLRIRREIALREAAALETVRQREMLQVTLASIGDGVIVTDASGRITFINKVAEDLSGWSYQEAIGSDCATIFHIINETSRKLVESPVAKVIRSGVVVGLANHTLLIRKDGGELPIDDSGAPIRDRDGSLRGVVLVFRDFSEHKNAEDALRRAMSDVQAANVAKDNFLATLSHELRTPLTPVVLTLAGWIEAGQPPGEWRDDVQMMQRNLELEARLIDDLLDLTRIVRGKLSLNETLADVNELVDGVVRMYESEIETKGLRLTLDLQAGQAFARVDPARLQQVVLNILTNATKFTPQGGEIQVRSWNAADRVLVSVCDTGMGIAPELQARLFRPFEQGAGPVVRGYGGLGLGMAIARALMEMQGGSIAASSDGPGAGSTFTLSIPLAEMEHGAACPLRDAATTAPPRACRILLVEDHADTARALRRLLERAGHQVLVADSMRDALARVREGGLDLMLSDIGLKDGTGLELIRDVRAFTAMPAVALTGFGMDEDVIRCRDAGFNEHLTKPIDFRKLEAIIQDLTREGTRGTCPIPGE
jgi:PAS domain S-box-containing protein